MSAPFDRKLLALRLRRALAAPPSGADFLQRLVAEDLANRLAAIQRTFPLGVDLGGHGGRVAAVMRASHKAERVLRADLLVSDPAAGGPDVVIDDAVPPFGEASLDLIASALTLHWVNDLPGTLIQLRRALRPDGLLLAAMFGGDTLAELRDVLIRAETELSGGVSPRVAPFASTRELGALLQRAGFALPVADQDTYTVRYDDMLALMRDLRAMGATSVLAQRGAWASRRLFLKAAELYAQSHADDDGRIRATFQVITLTGWAPHESQQQPLRPGSAKTRLAEALGTVEKSLGEKPSGR